MINCKKHIIAAGFVLMLPLTTWSEAPVFDDSDNFAIVDEQQVQEAPVADSKYDVARNDNYPRDDYQDDESLALAKDDQLNNSSNSLTNNANLIDKIQNLQQELQELRGQLEVQAHDLKLLQQQQIAFYKDLDARLSGSSVKASAPTKPSKTEVAKPSTAEDITPISSTSRTNPADEQISYLAAYELVKNKRFDDALSAMNVFVQKYPKGGYTANAHYWLGELYLVNKEYVNAIDHFNIVLQQFPTSSKSAASMLKIGYGYAAQGNTQEAKKYLQQVVRAYPDTPTAQLATSKLRTI